MVSYLIKLLVLISFSFVILTTYYSSKIHIESFTGYFIYFFIMTLFYFIYKSYLGFINKKSISLTIFNIFSLFLINLFVLSLTFFSLNDLKLINGFILFFSIIIYLILPFLISIISLSFGQKILSYISIFKDQSKIFQFISSISLGLVIFITSLSILGFLGQYNFYSVLFIIGFFLVFSADILFINLKNIFIKKIYLIEGNPIKYDFNRILKFFGNNLDSTNRLDFLYIFIILSIFSLLFGIIINVIGIIGFFLVFIIFYYFIILTLSRLNNLGLKYYFIFLNLIPILNVFFSLYLFLGTKSDNDKGLEYTQKTSYLLSTEFLFFILTLLISINFINIVRPMPIGWDDLGVYMNFPQQMALSGTNMMYGGMNAWQTLTGIGFMLKSNVQAFFFNNLGGILSTIFLILITSDLLRSTRKTFINIPLLITTIFMAMPMVIFQQAKDMKLDIGLFAFSIAGIYMFYYIFSKYIGSSDERNISNDDIIINYDQKIKTGEKDLFTNKGYLILFFIVGVIIGFTFSIKLTSLITISALIGVIFYSKLGITGLLGYLSLFIAIFTKGHLWDKLNVVYPSTDTVFINNVFLIGIVISIIFFALSFVQFKQKAFIKTFMLLGVFLFGIVSILSPRFIKNLYQSNGEIGINNLISGKSDRIIIDYGLIHSENELEYINQKHDKLGLNSSGTTNHEDFGRYFGYEKGINNYLKLPWNLTMQTNQPGEYTDITYIYLALIPVILLFLTYSNSYFAIGNLIILSGISSYFLIGSSGRDLTNLLSSINLPFGYIIIFVLFLLPTLYYLLALGKGKFSVLFKINLVFTFFYTFLWTISAYGIVWYGISMYFGFLLMIAIGVFYISYYDELESQKNNIIRLFGSLVILLIISIYFFNSSLPHGFKNLKNASYASFKSGEVTQSIGIFDAHVRYLSVLAELNLNDNKGELFKTIITKYDTSKNSVIINILNGNLTDFSDIKRINNLLLELYKVPKEKININHNDLDIIRNKLFSNILYPPRDYKNIKGIYRIGTFLKYFTSENYNRFLEDNLINNFDKYIYSLDSDTTVNRMKTLGLNYFLVDLNAATIDKDPRHDLTRRFELLLDTFKSDKLELIETDSLCLKLGLDQYNVDKNFSKYMALAGVNYESYIIDEFTKKEKSINRRNKQLVCYTEILNLINTNKIDINNYSYLLEINDYIKYQFNKGLLKDPNEVMGLLQRYVNHGWFVLFKIK